MGSRPQPTRSGICSTDEFELVEAAEVPDRETHTGKQAFIANLAKLEQSFDELRIQPLEFVDLDDRIVVVVSMVGRGRGSEVPVEGNFAQLWSLRDGKAVSLSDHATKGGRPQGSRALTGGCPLRRGAGVGVAGTLPANSARSVS